MKITKRQLKKLIAEARMGSVGVGFVGWGANKSPDFSKSFGSEGSYASDLLKSRIRNIVREEVETLSYEEETISEEQANSAALAVDKASDIQTVSGAWAGGSNLTQSIDHSKAVDSEPVTRGQEILKLTESQIRKIVKEIYDEEDDMEFRDDEYATDMELELENDPLTVDNIIDEVVTSLENKFSGKFSDLEVENFGVEAANTLGMPLERLIKKLFSGRFK